MAQRLQFFTPMRCYLFLLLVLFSFPIFSQEFVATEIALETPGLVLISEFEFPELNQILENMPNLNREAQNLLDEDMYERSTAPSIFSGIIFGLTSGVATSLSVTGNLSPGFMLAGVVGGGILGFTGAIRRGILHRIRNGEILEAIEESYTYKLKEQIHQHFKEGLADRALIHLEDDDRTIIDLLEQYSDEELDLFSIELDLLAAQAIENPIDPNLFRQLTRKFKRIGLDENFTLRFYRSQVLEVLAAWKQEIAHAEYKKALFSSPISIDGLDCGRHLSFLKEAVENL